MKISQVLKNSEIPQVFGALIRYDWDTKEFEGKCALGVLACESGDPNLKLNEDRLNVNHRDILIQYGINDISEYPMIRSNANDLIYWDFDDLCSLSTLIVSLNDNHRLTFEQIGEFLEVTFDL